MARTGLRSIAAVFSEGGAFSKKIKVVCGRCNSGWMSRLEKKAGPILRQLFLASPAAPVRLDRGEQDVLARWAAKTAVVISAIDHQYRTQQGLTVVHRV